MATSNYSWNLPTVGGSEDTWGASLNANWTALDTLLGGTNATEFAILDGATVTTAELNLLDGAIAHLTADWEAGTAMEPGLPSPADVKAAIEALVPAPPGAPAGSILWFAGSSAPSGYLKANGALVSRTTYAALFAAIGTAYGAGDGSTTFSLPDLRGEFIRGWDDGRGVDSARSLGSAQSNELQSHTHTGSTSSAGAHSHTLPGLTSGIGASGLLGGEAAPFTPSTDVAGAHTHSLSIDATGGSETRPRNIALLACIKI